MANFMDFIPKTCQNHKVLGTDSKNLRFSEHFGFHS